MANKKDRGPGVKFPPPVLPAGSILLGYLLGLKLPLGFSAPALLIGIGKGLMVLSLSLAGYMVFQYWRNKTSIEPFKPDSVFMQSGPFKYSRNPIYLSFCLFQIGTGLVMQNWLILLLVAATWYALVEFVIKREERYLEQVFGKPYQQYKLSVRRWL
jgi:protein-S-isoprenylcysteine O-methyltransferase Ste14